MKKIIAYTFLVGLCFSLLSCGGEKKEVLYQIPADIKIKECSPIFSQDCEHFAAIKEEMEGEAVIYDGEVGKVYTAIDAISLSPSGKNFAYLAVDGKNEVIVKDGKEIAKYSYKTVIKSEDRRKTLQFLDDGSLIFTKKEPKKMKKVIKDGKPIDGSPYSAKPEVSKDGKHLLYWVVDGTGDFLVFDGKRHKIDGLPLFLSISGDGEHYGAVVSNGKTKKSVIVDGKKKTTLDSKNPVEYFLLSEKGDHFIVLQRDITTNEIKVKFDGVVVAVANKVFTNSVAFSKDDLHYAFIMIKPRVKRASIVLDGEEIPSFDPDFSTINECFGEGRSLVFSPDDEHLLYVAGTGTNQILAFDQKVFLRFDLYNTVIYQPFFSPEGDVICFFMDKLNKQLAKIKKEIK